MNSSAENGMVLLLPAQQSRYSVMHDIFSDLYSGFKLIGLEASVVEVTTTEKLKASFIPDFNLKKISGSQVKDIINSGSTVVTIDAHDILRLMHSQKMSLTKVLVWAHYFYGQRFLFEQYRAWGKETSPIDGMKHLLSGFVPNALLKYLARSYIGPLKKTNVIAQSLWTALLLNRTYNIQTKGVVYLPIDPAYYDLSLDNQRKDTVLIFFGDKLDTNLDQLTLTVRQIRSIVDGIDLCGFGNNDLAEEWSQKSGEKLKFRSSVPRKELSILYNKSLLTISPVFNGNFEKVPIESLLTGTPTISYIQPFFEVTGESELVANIANENEVKTKLGKWLNDSLALERASLKNKILSHMDHKKVARDILRMIK